MQALEKRLQRLEQFSKDWCSLMDGSNVARIDEFSDQELFAFLKHRDPTLAQYASVQDIPDKVLAAIADGAAA